MQQDQLGAYALLCAALSIAHTEMGNRLVNVATAEAHPPLATAFRKLGRTWHSLGDLDQAQVITIICLVPTQV